ncbi:hypothetical protein PINS_up007784 [Pythium insidiosum]|nr:hypothetical protein PINS_up007784 [Pythium insidiosum]
MTSPPEEQQRDPANASNSAVPPMPPIRPLRPAQASATRVSLLQLRSLPPWGFRLAWLAILLLHALCAFYFSLNAHIYDKTPGSSLGLGLSIYGIGMPMQAYPTLTNIHALFAAVHVCLGVVMIVWSLWKRRLSFGPLQELSLESTSSSGSFSSKTLTKRLSGIGIENKRLGSFVSHGSHLLRALASLFSRRGFFGVEGDHFDDLLAVREIVESVLQTYQAYRMSRLLARPWLNRLYVALLVFNCWMVPIVHLAYRNHRMKRRALSLFCDALLDFMSAMGVPILLEFSYYASFDTVSWGFPYHLWYNETWYANVMTEFQIMLVNSWADLASRIVFSLGLISCIENTKELLFDTPSPKYDDRNGANAAGVDGPPSALAVVSPAPHISSPQLRVWTSFRKVPSRPVRRLLQALQALCAVLGLVVVVVHLYAERAPVLEQCAIQVRPWFERRPACVLVQWNCHTEQHTGEATAIEAGWSKTTPEHLRGVLVAHCPQFEMPPRIRAFNALVYLKFYNTTIAAWGDDAALTAASHPQLLFAYLARVNMSTTGELPAGLASPSFPPTLANIQIAVSNMRKLPDDLDTKWPPGMFLTCEACQFSSLPPVFLRLKPYWVELGFNPFTSFPFEVFRIDGIDRFGFAGVKLPTLIPPQALNESLVQGTTLRYLFLLDSGVTLLPRWVDDFLALPRIESFQAPFDLSFTPICDALHQMTAGTMQRFPPEWTANVPADQVSDLMYTTSSNVSEVLKYIDCPNTVLLLYPLDDEDARHRDGK